MNATNRNQRTPLIYLAFVGLMTSCSFFVKSQETHPPTEPCGPLRLPLECGPSEITKTTQASKNELANYMGVGCQPRGEYYCVPRPNQADRVWHLEDITPLNEKDEIQPFVHGLVDQITAWNTAFALENLSTSPFKKCNPEIHLEAIVTAKSGRDSNQVQIEVLTRPEHMNEVGPDPGSCLSRFLETISIHGFHSVKLSYNWKKVSMYQRYAQGLSGLVQLSRPYSVAEEPCHIDEEPSVRESFAGGYNVRARGESYFLPRDILDAIEKHYRAALKKRGCFKGALGIEIFRHSDGRVSGAWVVSDNVGGAMAQATIREFVRGKDFHVKAEHLHIKSTIVFLPNVKELRPRLKVSSDEFQVRFGYKSYPAEVEFGPLKHLEGKQDLKKTHRMFLRHQGKIRTCYQIELKKMEKIEGKVGFRFEVNAGGRVNEVAVLKNELNETAEACLLRAVKRIRFEKSEFDKNSFEVTFEFRPLKKEDQP